MEKCYICDEWNPIEHVYIYRGKKYMEILHLDKYGKRVRDVCGIGGPTFDFDYDQQLQIRNKYWQRHDFLSV
jgi:hypothetical protein